jgi:hypothetical protein
MRRSGFASLRRQLDEKHPPHSFRYVPKNIAVFGQTGKTVTIGCSRKPPPPPEEFPGPGAYQVDPKTLYVDLPHLIQNRPESDYRTLTSDVDFLALTPFTRPSTHIGNRDNVRFFSVNDAPPPTYVVDTRESLAPLTIGQRFVRQDVSDAPGPGEYPVSDTRPGTAGFTIPHNPKRELWNPPPITPDPGEYNILPPLSKPKRWAEKLRTPCHPTNARKSLRDEIQAMAK